MYLEDLVEPRFHPDSYGYRLRRSALDAVEVCRERCWRKNWVIDLDVAKFFDTVPWDLMIKAVEAVTDTPWVLLYVRRWLAAPLMSGTTLVERDKGTPQGSAVSPVLANLFMHFAFDNWLAKKSPGLPVRALCRQCCRALCDSGGRPKPVLADNRRADGRGGPQPPPGQDGIVYCKDDTRRGDNEHVSFTFLGFTFRARTARSSLNGRSVHLVPACDEQRGAQGQRCPSSVPCGSIGAPP